MVKNNSLLGDANPELIEEYMRFKFADRCGEYLDENIKTFIEFLSETKIGEGTIVIPSYLEPWDSPFDAEVITDVIKVIDLKPEGEVYYRGRVYREYSPTKETKLELYKKGCGHEAISCILSEDTQIVATPKRFDELEIKELEELSEKINVSSAELLNLQDNYKEEKERVNAEIGKAYFNMVSFVY